MKYLLALVLVLPACCKADWKDSVTNSLLFVAGIAASYTIHEIGHELTARAYGEKLDWHTGIGLEWSCRSPCENISSIAIAGNVATAITGELLLLLPNKENPFVDGMQAYNSVNPIGYAYKDARSPYGDYSHVNDTAQIALAIHAATIGHRQFSKRLWSVYPKQRGVQVRVSF